MANVSGTARFYRGEHTICLPITGNGDPIELLEDCEVELRIRLPRASHCALLWIGNKAVPLALGKQQEEQVEARLDGGRHRLFLNCFGQSVVRVSWELQDHEHSADLFVVDVLATKVNAERALRMLLHIENEFESILNACFSRTGIHAATGEAGQPMSPWAKLAFAENVAEQLLQLMPRFRWRKVARLLPAPTVGPWTPAVTVGGLTVEWLLLHLDSLVRSESTSMCATRVRGRYMEPTQVLSERLEEDTDVYENRVLHGFCDLLREEVREIDTAVKELVSDLATRPTPESRGDYLHFVAVGSQFARSFYSHFSRRLEPFAAALDVLADEFKTLLPVAQLLRERPQLTPGFQRFSHYRRVFELANEWHSQGAPTFVAERFLLGLKSLDKVFEFYCLVRIIESLRQLGFSLESTRFEPGNQEDVHTDLEERPADQYMFARGPVQITLHYEPCIAPDGHSSGLIDVHHRGSGKYSRWSPDFVLEFRAASASHYVILDAKYQSGNSARRSLAEMTLKYIHGLGRLDARSRSVDAMFLLYAGDTGDEHPMYCYQATPHGLLDKKPAMPAIGGLQVAPGRDDLLREILGRFVAIWMR